MPAFPFMELALCMALWTIARQLRTFTKPEILSGWRGLALSPVRLVAVIAAKLSGFMTIGFFCVRPHGSRLDGDCGGSFCRVCSCVCDWLGDLAMSAKAFYSQRGNTLNGGTPNP